MRWGLCFAMLLLLLGAAGARAQDAIPQPANGQPVKPAKAAKVIKPKAIKAELEKAEPELTAETMAEFGWNVVIDPATGILIGLPTKLVPNARDAARGTRWSSAHGDVQVETFRIVDHDLKLSALFEQEKREPVTRKIEYSVLRDDSFFISGFQGLKKFSVKAQFRDGEVRGFTILYDQMMETIVAPVMVAMSASFNPFPERSAPYAALAKSVEYGTGLVVSAQGHIVTDAKLTQGCQVIVASGLGDAVRVAARQRQWARVAARLWPAQIIGAGAAARCGQGCHQVWRFDAGRYP